MTGAITAALDKLRIVAIICNFNPALQAEVDEVLAAARTEHAEMVDALEAADVFDSAFVDYCATHTPAAAAKLAETSRAYRAARAKVQE